MKKSTIFILFAFCISGYAGLSCANEQITEGNSLFSFESSLAQGFFIPEYELAPKYEKLPPIKRKEKKAKNLKDFNNKYEIEKYVLINGVYSPVFKKRTVAAPVQTPEYSDNEHPQVIADVKNEEEVPEIKEKETPVVLKEQVVAEPIVQNPEFDEVPFDKEAPMYRNIFAQYRADAKVFKKNKKYPFNNYLDESLSKMTSNDPIVVFSGELNVK